MKRKSVWIMVLTGVVGLVVVASLQIAWAHGSTSDPVSRILSCYLEYPETPDTLACKHMVEAGGTQPLYDWNEVSLANAAGNHQAFIPDGRLCSAGRDKYAALDTPRTDWARTLLPTGETYTFLYHAHVPHNQGYFDLYVTKDGYDPTQMLTWGDLELMTTVVEPPLVDGNYYIPVDLPAGKSGHHLIYTIWQRTDSPEAFYACSDVWFGNGPTPTPTAVPLCTAPTWSSSVVYATGTLVTHNGIVWEAKWENGNVEPSYEGTSNSWYIEGYCQAEGGVTPSPTATTVPPTATATGAPPTATSIPPTATAVPPTATVIPPTATAVPPTATPTTGATCTVDYTVASDWGTGFVANLTITNEGATPINGWAVGFDFSGNQTNVTAWNGVASQVGTAVAITNASWNETIPANGSVTVGFQATYSGVNAVPTSFTLNGSSCN